VNVPARGRAGGKVILLGEHAVVYGRPALAAGIALGLEVELARGNGPCVETDRPETAADERPLRLLGEAARLFDLDPRSLIVRVRSTLPPGVGFGSSAALSVALLRACAVAAGRVLDGAEELALGRRLEAVFHGHPSGIDPAAAALGGCFRFVRGEPPDVTPLAAARPLPLVVAYPERGRSTGAAVGALRARWDADRARYESLFDDVGAVVDTGARAIAAGDLRGLGHAMDENQRLLAALGVSSASVDGLIMAAHDAGALGAKLTGGGAGGAVIALADDPVAVATKLGADGVRTMVVRVDARPDGAARASA
jgi:mevalonate kinase